MELIVCERCRQPRVHHARGQCKSCRHVMCRQERGIGPCVHCGRRVGDRPRGLCAACYYVPALRQRYAVRPSKFNAQGSGLVPPTRPPAVPTEALPGTPEKVEVMRQRLERGEALYHPEDAVRRTA